MLMSQNTEIHVDSLFFPDFVLASGIKTKTTAYCFPPNTAENNEKSILYY